MRPGWITILSSEGPDSDGARRIQRSNFEVLAGGPPRVKKNTAYWPGVVAAWEGKTPSCVNGPENADTAGERSARRESVIRLLQANHIVIQLWERAASAWEKPIKITLSDFFLRLGLELVVEKSAR